MLQTPHSYNDFQIMQQKLIQKKLHFVCVALHPKTLVNLEAREAFWQNRWIWFCRHVKYTLTLAF